MNLKQGVDAGFAHSYEVNAGRGLHGKVSEKQKKSNDQRAPVTTYYRIKEIRSRYLKYCYSIIQWLENFHLCQTIQLLH